MRNKNLEVFVSYPKSTDNDKKIIRDLKKRFSKIQEIKLIYDEEELKPGDSIKKFIERLGEGKTIIVVFSDAYAKSNWCMYELLKIFKNNNNNNNLRNHIIPIVVGNCDLNNLNYRVELKEFWKDEELALNKSRSVENTDKSQRIREVNKNLDEILNFLCDRKHYPYDELKANDFKELINHIQPCNCQPPMWAWFVLSVASVLLPALLGYSLYTLSDSTTTLIEISNVKLNEKEDEIKKLQDDEQTRSENKAEKRLSIGEKYFLEAYFDKRIGAKVFSIGEYEGAKSEFENSLIEMPDDPEARIYLENVKAIADARAYSKKEATIRTIAVSVPIQTNITAAKEILRGVAQAQKITNDQWRKDCKHHPVSKTENCGNRWLLQVHIASDDNDPEIARSIAKHIVAKRKEILAVIGHNSSQVSNTVMDEYQNKLVMISPTSYTLDHSKPEITNASNNYIFTMAFPVEKVLPEVINYINSSASEEIKKYLYFCADPDAHDTARFIESLKQGITLKGVKEKEYDSKKYNIECDISNLKSHKLLTDENINELKLTDLFLSVHVKTVIDGIVIARKNSRNSTKLNLYNANTLFIRDAIGEDLNGLVVAVNWHSKSLHSNKESARKSKEFLEDAESTWKRKPDMVNNGQEKFDPDIDITWRSAMAYDATQLIIKGLNQIPLLDTGDKARKELQKEISKLEFNGVTGPIKFDKNGKRDGGESYLVKLQERCDGKYQFVPIEKQDNNSYELIFPKGIKFKSKNLKTECAS